MRPNIFIGSSSEGLALAKAIKIELDKKFTATVWTEDLFALGHDTLSDLLRFVQCFDFAVLVLLDDDKTMSRGTKKGSPRDNVIFEMGLFMGALGRRRTFPVVAETTGESLKIPSDLLGNTALYLPRDFHQKIDSAQIPVLLEQLVQTIDERSKESILQLLPSTSLAIGYFQNFVSPVCRELSLRDTIELGADTVDISKDNFDFTIVLPSSLSDASTEGAKKFVKSSGAKDFNLKTSSRHYHYYVNSEIVDNKVVFYDYPTTLRASHDAVALAFAGPYLGGKERKALDQKEISNFERTLKILLNDPSASGFRNNVKFINA